MQMNDTMIFLPITKIDSVNQLVYLTCTSETKDIQNQICDYDGAKPEFQKWSEEFNKVTFGKSYGNIRLQHRADSPIGKVNDPIEYDDANKKINLCVKVVDPNAWSLVEQGVLTGASIGGKYKQKWYDSQSNCTRYVPDVHEVSLVDKPCNPDCRFSVIKADGSIEERKFTSIIKDTKMENQENIPTAETDLQKGDGVQHGTDIGPKQDSAKEDADHPIGDGDGPGQESKVEGSTYEAPEKANTDSGNVTKADGKDGDGKDGDGKDGDGKDGVNADKCTKADGKPTAKDPDGDGDDDSTPEGDTDHDQGKGKDGKDGDVAKAGSGSSGGGVSEGTATATGKCAQADKEDDLKKAVAERKDVNPKEGEKKYGKVEYADDTNNKYPLDTPEHVRAAASYWGMPKNKAKYSSSSQAKISAAISAAEHKFGIGDVKKADDMQFSQYVLEGMGPVIDLILKTVNEDELQKATELILQKAAEEILQKAAEDIKQPDQDLEKAGAKHSKEHLDALQKAHHAIAQLAGEAGMCKCNKCSGAYGSDGLKKADDVQNLTEVLQKVDGLQKTVTDLEAEKAVLLEKVAKLEAQPDDSNAPITYAIDKEPLVKSDSQEDLAKSALSEDPAVAAQQKLANAYAQILSNPVRLGNHHLRG